MSGISKAAEEIRQKMSFDDYKKTAGESAQKADASKSASRRYEKKIKVTLYLTEEEDELFTQVYIKRLQESKKTDRSTLISEAIRLLHQQEMAVKAK